MSRTFTQQLPITFTLNRRMHSVSSWKELVHELLEDMFMTLDRDGARITDAFIPETDKKIIYRTDCPGKFIVLSNGLQLPWDYSEQEYALACRIICIIYNITPCEMNITFAESTEINIPPDEPSPKKIPATELKEKTAAFIEENPTDEKEIKNYSDGFEKNLTNDIQIESNHGRYDHISNSEEKWMKLFLSREEETKPSDRIQVTTYDAEHEIMTGHPDWDSILDNLKNDRQAYNAAKLMKKEGIKAPIMNFRGIIEHNKIGGEALFVWMDEGVAYLHGLQKYSRGYFFERGFNYVIVDNPRELVDCFRKMETDHE